MVIVESPTKIDTLKKIIGKGFTIKASVGHLKDLPKKKLGVDVENDFKPDYITIRGKGKILAALKAAAKKADDIYLAPDPDRKVEREVELFADAAGSLGLAAHGGACFEQRTAPRFGAGVGVYGSSELLEGQVVVEA